MSGLLQEALPAERLVVAIDPGKVANRVWLATGEGGLIGEPVSLPTLREGVEELERLVRRSGIVGAPLARRAASDAERGGRHPPSSCGSG